MRYLYDRVVKALLSDSRGHINAPGHDGTTPLVAVVIGGDVASNTGTEDARILLNGGANVNLASATGDTPLMAAAEGGHVYVYVCTVDTDTQHTDITHIDRNKYTA